MVLTIDDQPAILGATTLIRSLAPRTMIVARARDLATSKALLRAGANKAFPEAVEASLTLAAEVLISIGVTAKDTELFLSGRAQFRLYASPRCSGGRVGRQNHCPKASSVRQGIEWVKARPVLLFK